VHHLEIAAEKAQLVLRNDELVRARVDAVRPALIEQLDAGDDFRQHVRAQHQIARLPCRQIALEIEMEPADAAVRPAGRGVELRRDRAARGEELEMLRIGEHAFGERDAGGDRLGRLGALLAVRHGEVYIEGQAEPRDEEQKQQQSSHAFIARRLARRA